MKNKEVVLERHDGVQLYIHERYGANTPEARGVNKESLLLVDLVVDLIEINKELLAEIKAMREEAKGEVKKVATATKVTK
jgi:hypothetical protein